MDLLKHTWMPNLYDMGRRFNDHYRFATQSLQWVADQEC